MSSLRTPRDPLGLAPGGGRLRLGFQATWSEDRYGHAIDLLAADQSIRVMNSIERGDSDLWPLSPPIQQLLRHDQPHSPIGSFLAGLGMAGSSHWSLSVEVSSDGQGLVWDVACRTAPTSTGIPGWLGSTYDLAPDVALVDNVESAELQATEQRLILQLKETLIELKIEPCGPTIPAGKWSQNVFGRLQIVPAMATERTRRWKYRLRLLDGEPIVRQNSKSVSGA